MVNSNRKKTLKMAQIALISALVIILQVFFSQLRVGPVTLSFVLVPIVISGIFISPSAAMFIGFLAGVTTFLQVMFTPSDPFYLFLATTNPIATCFICLLKTSLAGLLSGIAYKLLIKKWNHKSLCAIVSAVICPVVNTGLFCLGMLVFFGNALQTDPTFGALASGQIIYFVFIVLAGLNFIVEFILNIILCPIITKALYASKIFK